MLTARLVVAGLTLATAMLAGCASSVTVVMPAPRVIQGPPHTGTGQLCAGAATVDITPPPGPPSLGHSIAAKHGRFDGHQTRLRAHAIVIEDASGEVVALVTADLAWSSTIVRWKVAERVVERCGIPLDRIMLAGTHTHTGPSGFSSWALFNEQFFSSAGYDPVLVSFLVDRISGAIESAYQGMIPARLAIEQVTVDDLTRNRSIKAHRSNYDVPSDSPGIDPRLTVLRIDAKDGTPIAAFCVFAGHPTVVGPRRQLWHADVFGIASHEVRRHIEAETGAANFVVAIANGSEADVSFNWKTEGCYLCPGLPAEQGHEMAVCYGRLLAERIECAWARAEPAGTGTTSIASRLERRSLPKARLAFGETLAKEPRVGVSAIGGTEEGYSIFHTLCLSREGQRSWFPSQDHGAKSFAFGPIQPLLVNRNRAPTFIPIQVIRIKTGIKTYYLLALPFELTTQNAVRLRRYVVQVLAAEGESVTAKQILVVSAANDYCLYCATADEYDAQHYEGGFTLYGPRTAQFLAEQSAHVAAALVRDDPRPALQGYSFRPGRVSAPSRAVPEEPTGPIQPIARCLDAPQPIGGRVAMSWLGLPRDRIQIDQGWLVRVEVERDDGSWEKLVTKDGPENDLGFHFEVCLLCDAHPRSRWQVTWNVPTDVDRSRRYRFALADRPGALTASSAPFKLRW